MTRIVATDDLANRLEFKWLGPVNMPMPVPARGAAWIMGVLAWGPVSFVVGALLPQPIISAMVGPTAALLVWSLLTLLITTVVTVLLVRGVGKLITPTRPLRHHAALLMAELHDPREKDDEEVVLSPPWAATSPAAPPPPPEA